MTPIHWIIQSRFMGAAPHRKYGSIPSISTASVTRFERPSKAFSRVARNEVISSQPANRETVEWWTPNDFAICRHVSP